jgi:hypothetical protein
MEVRMKSTWSLLATAVASGGAMAAVALAVVAYQHGSQPSASDMELAAELGAAIGGTLLFAWPLRLLMR